MLMKPIVALMMQYSETVPGAFDIDPGYLRLLEFAGANVLTVDPSDDDGYLRSMLDRADGLLIPGGNDIDPSLYGGRHLPVNSVHHQAVHRAGEGVEVQATAADGIIESAYRPDRDFFMAVQWHPEQTPADEPSRRLARAFTEACRTYGEHHA